MKINNKSKMQRIFCIRQSVWLCWKFCYQ